jgi:hypothetical protein
MLYMQIFNILFAKAVSSTSKSHALKPLHAFEPMSCVLRIFYEIRTVLTFKAEIRTVSLS